ncbi:MAG: PadR family transcriptional regulator [Gemmatimonadales bacterium]
MARRTLDLMQGTLDLMVLKALEGGWRHGYDVMAWLREATDGQLKLEDAALYPSLHRLEARGLIESEWGLSENNRRAKFYRLTVAGQRALKAESTTWREYVALVGRVLTTGTGRPGATR